MRRSCESDQTVIGQGVPKDRKSQSCLKIEVDRCPLSRKQRSSGEAEYREAMLIREVLLFHGFGSLN